MDSGLYQLIIRLARRTELSAGRLKRLRLPGGFYVYTGSARKNLRARIARHVRREKRLRWHVDYLLQYGIIKKGFVYPLYLFTECELNRVTLKVISGGTSIPGFGASDCRCGSHLIHCTAMRDVGEIEEALCGATGAGVKRLKWKKDGDKICVEFID